MSQVELDTRQPANPFGQVYHGKVSRAPTLLSDLIGVTVPDIHPDLLFNNVNWQSRDNVTLPAVGDDCVVIFDNNRQPWVVTWWPRGQNPKVVNGQWLKGVSGSVVWSAITSADVGAQPFAKFHTNGTQALGAGWNALIYGVADVATPDPTAWQSPGYWLCRQAGTYLFVAHSAVSGAATSLYGLFTKTAGSYGTPTGGDPNGRVQFGPVAVGTDARIPTMTALYQCQPGDFVLAWLYSTAAGASTAAGEGQAATLTVTRVST